ncbi:MULTISPECIES: ATP-binding protein [unclassified Nonomuraea]|uniref:ATP-binding protein n=1 Tax=Nonomuraea sp. NPDC047529 TaxID=3155623 RepID=UPI0033C95A6B
MSGLFGPPPECRDPLLTWALSTSGPGGAAAYDQSALRKGVSAHATQQGLSSARRADLELAVQEGVANVFDHGGGSGRVRLWQADGLLCCEISDHGPGIPARHYQQRASMPARDRDHGRGLWLMAELSDSLTVTTGPAGTTVVIVVRLQD